MPRQQSRSKKSLVQRI